MINASARYIHTIILVSSLVFNTVYLNAMQKNHETPEDETKEYVQENEEKNKQLEMAIAIGNEPLAKAALNRGANPNGQFKGESYLVHSINENWHNISFIETMLQHNADPNVLDCRGTPLLISIVNPDIVELLIRYKADINGVDSRGCNVLFVSSLLDNMHNIFPADQCSKALLLIMRNADIHHRNEHNQTPLHDAARECKLGVVQALLKSKGDVHATDNEGNTPLHLLGQGNSFTHDTTGNDFITRVNSYAEPIARLLIRACSNLSAKNNAGISFLDQCERRPELKTVAKEKVAEN